MQPFCCLQVLRSIAFLHSLDLIHSDLKPENILVKSYSRSGMMLLQNIVLVFCALVLSTAQHCSFQHSKSVTSSSPQIHASVLCILQVNTSRSAANLIIVCAEQLL